MFHENQKRLGCPSMTIRDLKFFFGGGVTSFFSECVYPTLRKPTPTYRESDSMPTKRRLSRAATAQVVNTPAKGSTTKSPLFELALIIRSNSASGFCDGCATGCRHTKSIRHKSLRRYWSG